MNKKKPINTFIIFFVIISLFCILSVMPTLIVFSKTSDNLIVKYGPELLIIYFIFWIVIFINRYNKNKNYIEKTIQEETPRKAIITDILIYGRITGNSILTFCPIVKELKTNKLYISAEYKNLAYITTGQSFLSPLRYTLKSMDGNIVNIGDEVNLYIKKELGKLEKTNDTVLIYGWSYKYIGKLSDFRPKDFPHIKYVIFNEVSDNFMNDLDELNVFEGVVDFDAYK